jgi:hypothetical protein
MKKLIYSIVWCIYIFVLLQSFIFAQSIDPLQNGTNDRFEQYIGAVIGSNLQDNIDLVWYEWQNDGKSIIDFVIDFLNNRVFPMLLILSMVVVVVGCIEFMFTDWTNKTQEWIQYIIWWIVWIVLLMSISYIIWVLVWWDWWIWNVSDSDGIFEQFWRTLWFTDIYYEYDNTKNGVWLITQIYEKLMYPFIKFVSYLLVWVLFLILLGNVFKYLTSGDDESMQSKSLTICAHAIIGILLIASAKFIVQFVYGVQAKVLKQNITNLWQVGWQIGGLDPASVANTTIIFNYLNRWLSFIAFVIVILIILNAYKLLFAWDNADALTKTRKYFLYLAIWLLIIGLSYMIINILIVK